MIFQSSLDYHKSRSGGTLTMDDFSGKTALVTGAASGIGEAIALKLLAEGANVVGMDLQSQLDRFKKEQFAAHPNSFIGVSGDVTDEDAWHNAANIAHNNFGEINILINNAGVMTLAPLSNATSEDWDWIFSVNVFGVVTGVRVLLPYLRGAEEAHIVNTGSMAGLAPRLEGIQAIYSASKASVVSFSEMLRSELAKDDIGVSVLCPHTIDTDIWGSEKHRPSSYGESHEFEVPDRASTAMNPSRVAEIVLEGIRDNRGFIFTDAEGVTTTRIPERMNRIEQDLDWLKGKIG